MESDGAERYRDRLLVERFAAWMGFERLAEAIPGRDPYPPYLFVGFWILFDVVALNGYRQLTGGTHALLVDPFWAAIPAALVLAIVGVRYMADGYADAVAHLRVHDRLEASTLERFERPVSLRVKLGLYLVALVVFVWNVLFNLGLPTIFAIEGVVPGLVANFFLIPLVWLPLMVEFTVLYFTVHVVLPRHIASADIGLFYYDPRNMGGFAPVGQLLKRSYYLFTAGLLLYFVMTYGNVVLSSVIDSPYPDPGVIAATFFTLAWLVGIGSMAYSMQTIHRVMASEKERHSRRLEERLREAIDDPYDIESAKVTDSEKLADCRDRLEQVRATKEYPTTLTMWSQILVSVLLPQALNMAVQMGA